MYTWREMTEDERQEVLDYRKKNSLPWHNPPHLDLEGDYIYLITAACFNHLPIIGKNKERLIECEKQVLDGCDKFSEEIFAWCILPNHYHVLLQTEQIKSVRRELGLFHGRSSRTWNIEDKQTGRQVWHNCFERPMKSERHYYASLNYVHHNAVYHEYVSRWTDWLFSSARDFLEEIGEEKAVEIWRSYPILDYGKKWDIF
ncbi:MAG: transposase [Candidatus Electryonea clarkiae]|nr:transposase [Candidatus Electryonea clarkiae]MDP8289223.1 transposase [Candidatus Electryonea clarkiae]